MDLEQLDLSEQKQKIKREDILSAYERGKRDFRDIDLRGVDLSGANLSEIDLRGAYLRHSNFSHANLIGAKLHRADCQCSNFTGANLSGASLTEAQFDGASLENADLSESKCAYAYMPKAKLDCAVLQKADFYNVDSSRASLRGCDFRFANLANTSFRYANLSRAIFRNSNLSYAYLSSADCHQADFRQAKLNKCSMANARLDQADFRLTNIEENETADLTGAVLDSPEAKDSWQKVAEWQGNNDTRFSIDASGQKLAYGVDSTRVDVVDLSKGDLSQTETLSSYALTVDFLPVVSAAFGEKGDRFHTYLYRNSLSLWNAAYQKEDELTEKAGTVAAVVVDAQGRTALLPTPSTEEESQQYFNLGAEQRQLSHGDSPGHTSAASPDGKLIAKTTSEDPSKIVVCEAETEKIVHTIAHQSPAQSVSFSPDSQRVLSMSADDTFVWHIQSAGQHKREYRAHFYTKVAPPWPHFVQSSQLLVAHAFYEQSVQSASQERYGTSLAWNINGRSQSAGGSDVAVSGDRTKVAQKFQTHLIQVWDIPTRQYLGCLPLQYADESFLSLNFDGSQLLTTYGDRIKLWDGETETVVQTFKNDGRSVYVGIFDRAGDRIITGGDGGIIRLWDIASGDVLQTLYSFSDVHDLALHPDKPLLLSGHYSQEVILWDLKTGEALSRFSPYGKESGHSISQIAFRPGYEQIVTCDRTGIIRLWDLPDYGTK